MRNTCYLRKGTVYLPTLANAPGSSLYELVEPIAVIPATEVENLRQAMREKILAGNPPPSAPRPPRTPEPVVLPLLAGVKTWSAFDRGVTATWSITDQGGSYKIIPLRRYSSRGGWVPDTENTIFLPPGADLDAVCDRMVELIQAAETNKT
ncbi:hypothetical protein GCM10011611_24580 [Aliidongia dinghuensis]|uniref:Uncharacterized protein n=1 Tax=Aliidongia dinghuensis TaxID=1867774 RepID=A0A8J2YT62_9PROT|nr:hypothetical protein [Aliidongia dinghuensis]GGF17814.1 hypothetical protein GCM10011611_24580 [Aliidongia dinghuensis]